MSQEGTISVVVRSARPVARDVRQVQLARPDGQSLPPFTPGAHIDLHLAPGLVRQYSLCGAVEETSLYTVAVKLEPQSRGGSRAVHERLEPGVELNISLPRNNFPIDLDGSHSILIAGGIGITPLLCMARALLRKGRSFKLHYFSRSAEHAAFLDVLGDAGFASQTALHFGINHDETAASLDKALAARQPGAQVYVCGPRAFMDVVCKAASDREWPKDSVHLEYFNAGQQQQVAVEKELRVTLARTGTTLFVPPGSTIVDVLRAAGVDVETSCEQGVCGTCITRVLDGVPEHHDLFLTNEEKTRGDCMALCVSRAITPNLVLDL